MKRLTLVALLLLIGGSSIVIGSSLIPILVTKTEVMPKSLSPTPEECLKGNITCVFPHGEKYGCKEGYEYVCQKGKCECRRAKPLTEEEGLKLAIDYMKSVLGEEYYKAHLRNPRIVKKITDRDWIIHFDWVDEKYNYLLVFSVWLDAKKGSIPYAIYAKQEINLTKEEALKIAEAYNFTDSQRIIGLKLIPVSEDRHRIVWEILQPCEGRKNGLKFARIYIDAETGKVLKMYSCDFLPLLSEGYE